MKVICSSCGSYNIHEYWRDIVIDEEDFKACISIHGYICKECRETIIFPDGEEE